MVGSVQVLGRRWAVLVAGCVALLLVLGAVPVGAAHGGQHTKVVLEEFFLHGEATDQVTKLAGQRATLSQEAPGEGPPVVQSTSLAGGHPGTAEAARPANPSWVGAFTGQVGGDLALTLYTLAPLSTLTAAVQVQVDVRVYADPAGSNTLLGQVREGLRTGTDAPEAVTVTVPVAGVVQEELLVEVVKVWAVQHDVLVFYGAADVPSGFLLPTVVPCEENDPDPQCADDQNGGGAPPSPQPSPPPDDEDEDELPDVPDVPGAETGQVVTVLAGPICVRNDWTPGFVLLVDNGSSDETVTSVAVQAEMDWVASLQVIPREVELQLEWRLLQDGSAPWTPVWQPATSATHSGAVQVTVPPSSSARVELRALYGSGQAGRVTFTARPRSGGDELGAVPAAWMAIGGSANAACRTDLIPPA